MIARGLSAVVALMCVSNAVAAQPAPVPSTMEETRVVQAGMEWLIESGPMPRFRSAGGTLVLSRHTTNLTSEPVGRSHVVERSVEKALQLEASVFEAAAAQAGLRIATCEELSSDYSLCGLSQPWIWVVFYNPGIRSATATVVVELREVEQPLLADRPSVVGETYELILNKRMGEWVVDSAR